MPLPSSADAAAKSILWLEARRDASRASTRSGVALDGAGAPLAPRAERCEAAAASAEAGSESYLVPSSKRLALCGARASARSIHLGTERKEERFCASYMTTTPCTPTHIESSDEGPPNSAPDPPNSAPEASQSCRRTTVCFARTRRERMRISTPMVGPSSCHSSSAKRLRAHDLPQPASPSRATMNR